MAETTPPPFDDDGRDPKLALTRRDFLKTAGAGAVAAGVVGAAVGGTVAGAAVLGPGAIPLSLDVNGSVRKISVEPRVTLLDALRDELGLTGAKPACDRGACGACTVLLDGEPIASCLMLAADAEGRKITTVEGLGAPEAMSPLQTAFVECDALQCGFCTPGFVVAGTALLARNPDPTPSEIKEGLAGNLCRCGTYGRIFEAVSKAAKAQAAVAAKKG
jgi:aerobic-type carbon monoxide dehydrogenase small subunit (CoxS/CutS family)